MSSSMLRIDRVRKRRTDRWVLDGVSLSVERGIVYALLGESGTGKTTLLRCVAGLERLDEGSVEVDGSALFDRGRVVDDVRRRVGFVFQQHHLFAHMTALENVMEAPVHVAKVARETARARAEELLLRLGVAHRRDARPAELSGGESQRVAIARAMAMSPSVLLLDEPTSALDPARRKGVTALLRGLAESGTTVVLATHDIPFARDVATRAGMLAAGRLLREGPVEEVSG
jgi:ABC-type polar amino acid transport system ATPase subunit